MVTRGDLRILVIGDIFDATDLENAVEELMQNAGSDSAEQAYIEMHELRAIYGVLARTQAPAIKPESAHDLVDNDEGNQQVHAALYEKLLEDVKAAVLLTMGWSEDDLRFDAIVYNETANDYVDPRLTDEDGFTSYDVVRMIIKMLNVEDNLVTAID